MKKSDHIERTFSVAAILYLDTIIRQALSEKVSDSSI